MKVTFTSDISIYSAGDVVTLSPDEANLMVARGVAVVDEVVTPEVAPEPIAEVAPVAEVAPEPVAEEVAPPVPSKKKKTAIDDL
jgi:hypothetical protein